MFVCFNLDENYILLCYHRWTNVSISKGHYCNRLYKILATDYQRTTPIAYGQNTRFVSRSALKKTQLDKKYFF